jgi:hypothetical protein
MYGQSQNENDESINHLASKVNAIKNLSINIYDDVEQQNSLLDSMDQQFYTASSRVKSTVSVCAFSQSNWKIEDTCCHGSTFK